MSKAIRILEQTLAPTCIIVFLSAIVASPAAKIYPKLKLQELVNLIYRCTLPLALLYTFGWNMSSWQDLAFLGAMLVSQCVCLVLAALVALLHCSFEKSLQKYGQRLLDYAVILVSSQTAVTSIPQVNTTPRRRSWSTCTT